MGVIGRNEKRAASECPVTYPLRPDLINDILVGGGEGLVDNSEGIEICSFQYLD
jgi:N-acetylmuramic acid 6-phosphate (MurNAc-6-P) etherase